MSHDRTPEQIQQLAALNNAAWCVAMWRAHGLEVERTLGMVVCRGAPPRFYPNAVTIEPLASAEAQAEWLAALAVKGGARGVSVKDSFQTLNLRDYGYGRLFDASWIRRPGGMAAALPDLDWRLVEEAEQLAEWETAWRGDDPAAEPDTFRPALIQDKTAGILAGWRDETLAAGCVMAPTANVVGLANVFGDYAEVVNAAVQAFPVTDLVGYERDDELQKALACGFEPIGGLKVWATWA